MPRTARKVGTPATQRLRRIACDAGDGCGFSFYTSRAQLQRAGVFPCPACDTGRMIPADPEDARMVLPAEELDEHPAVIEFRAALSSVMHGQASHGIRGRQLRPAEEVALERVEKSRREVALARRLAAIRPVRDGARDDIPF